MSDDYTAYLEAKHDNLREEVARLRAIVEPATDLIDNIRANGLHDNWKTLAHALDDLARAALPRETT